NVGQLYAVDTFGAVVGTLLAGFFLILFLGLKEAAYLAGTVNLLIAVAVFALSRWLEALPATEARPGRAEETPADLEAAGYSPRIARLALWAAGVSGFCALALEVFWTRALVFFLDNSTHAFSTMLTAFLLGIAIGSFLIATFIDSRARLVSWLGATQLLIGLFAILAIPILNHSTPVLQRLAEVSLDAMLPWKWMGMRFATSLSVMLVPTILMGMTFPLVVKVYTKSIASAGEALGNVYSMNAVAGVLGSLLAGFVLIPLVGVHLGIHLIATMNVVMGGILILSDPSSTSRFRWVAVFSSGAVFVGLGIFFLTTGGTNS
ncbi:MAG: fused MFS/spermidine synthase, partial [Gemmatimonadota bacterium]